MGAANEFHFVTRTICVSGEKGNQLPVRPSPGFPGHLGNLYRAQVIRPGFWFHFGRQAAEQIPSAYKKIQMLQAPELPRCWDSRPGVGRLPLAVHMARAEAVFASLSRRPVSPYK
jgi:hypothetical protein